MPRPAPCGARPPFHPSAAAKGSLKPYIWRVEREEFAFHMVITAYRLLFRPVGIHDGFLMDPVLPNRISAGLLHRAVPRMRRTEVRPTLRRRTISALLTPDRWSLRISADLRAAVPERPSRLQFCRAWDRPARTGPAESLFQTRSTASVRDTNPTPR
jgi:hypothetical protein